MLEQRRAQEKGYITLKEAAQISNYAPDYIGQLIRAGKIEGEQVYSNVAWVTTEDSIRSYMDAKNKSAHSADSDTNIGEVAANFGVYISYIVLFTTSVIVLCVLYIFSVSLDQFFEQRVLEASLPEVDNVLLVDVYD